MALRVTAGRITVAALLAVVMAAASFGVGNWGRQKAKSTLSCYSCVHNEAEDTNLCIPFTVPELPNHAATCESLGHFETDSLCVNGTGCDLPQCRDGLDNDDDGQTDFPADEECDDGNDNDEFPLPDSSSSSSASDGSSSDGPPPEPTACYTCEAGCGAPAYMANFPNECLPGDAASAGACIAACPGGASSSEENGDSSADSSGSSPVLISCYTCSGGCNFPAFTATQQNGCPDGTITSVNVCNATCPEDGGGSSSSVSFSSHSASSSLSVHPLCGNGVLDGEEECDAGPQNGTEGGNCNIDCTVPECGDGTVQAGEQCDDGDDNVPLLIADIAYELITPELAELFAASNCLSSCQIAKCSDGIDNEDAEDGGADRDDLGCWSGNCMNPLVGKQAPFLQGRNNEGNPCPGPDTDPTTPQSQSPGETPPASPGETGGQGMLPGPDTPPDRPMVASVLTAQAAPQGAWGGNCVKVPGPAKLGADGCPAGSVCAWFPGGHRCKATVGIGGPCFDRHDCSGAYAPAGIYSADSPDDNPRVLCGMGGGQNGHCCIGGNCGGANRPNAVGAGGPGPLAPVCGAGGAGGAGAGGAGAGAGGGGGFAGNNNGGAGGLEGGGPGCGDGVKGEDEECDDGNTVDDDGCSNACTLPVVGARCAGTECADGGDAFCEAQGQVCTPTDTLPCVTCEAPVGGQCTGNECTADADGDGLGDGQAFCQSLGGECSLTQNLPCLTCVLPNACTNGRIDPLEIAPPNPGACAPDIRRCCDASGAQVGTVSRDPANACAFAACAGGTSLCGVPDTCVVGGCFGELCMPPDATPPATCDFEPDVACYRAAVCESQGGTCLWRQTPELRQCVRENTSGSCASGQSCLSVSACAAFGGGATVGCGEAGTHVCCPTSDIQFEECDDGNRIDTDSCTNECLIHCNQDADCPEGICQEGQCVDQCGGGEQAGIHPAPPGFFLESIKDMLDSVGHFSLIARAGAQEPPMQCEPQACQVDADCPGDPVCERPGGATQDVCSRDANGVCLKKCVMPRCIENVCITNGGVPEDAPTFPYLPCEPDDICENLRCGDGIVQSFGLDGEDDTGDGDDEQCDDGNAVANDGCGASCKLEVCGDGIVQAKGTDGIPNTDDDEQCDDGNQVLGDGCSVECRDENCGNAIVDPGEECDNGVNNSDTLPHACRTTCVNFSCGDGVVDPGGGVQFIGEECDCGPDRPSIFLVPGDPSTEYCRMQQNGVEITCHKHICTSSFCGDGNVNRAGLDMTYNTLDDEYCDNGPANTDIPLEEPVVCRDGTCSFCSGDYQCKGGVCVEGECKTIACYTDGDCNGEGICRREPIDYSDPDWWMQMRLAGTCRAGGCTDDSQCTFGTCQNGSCHQCYENSECLSGFCYPNGFCAEPTGCTNDAFCAATSSCRNNCREAKCGDGIVDVAAGETCDEGVAMFACLGTPHPACDCAGLVGPSESGSGRPEHVGMSGGPAGPGCCADGSQCVVWGNETCPADCGVPDEGPTCNNGVLDQYEECDVISPSFALFTYRPNRDGEVLPFLADNGGWKKSPASLSRAYAAIDHEPRADDSPDNAYIVSSGEGPPALTYFHLWDIAAETGDVSYIIVHIGVDFTGEGQDWTVRQVNLFPLGDMGVPELNAAIIVVQGDELKHEISVSLRDAATGAPLTSTEIIETGIPQTGRVPLAIDALDVVANFSNMDVRSCSSQCTLARCGNGFLEKDLGEQCDDGNVEAGDGCADRCELEICAVPS